MKDIKAGDQILLQQKKSSVRPPWDPQPYTVVDVQGSKVQATRGDDVKFRAKNNVKKLKPRPDKLKPKKGELREYREEEDLDVNMEKIRVLSRPRADNVADPVGHPQPREMVQGGVGAGVGAEQQGQEQGVEEEEAAMEAGSVSEDSDDSRFTITFDDQEERLGEVEHNTTRSGRAVIPPTRFCPDSNARRTSLSPRERKRRQSKKKKERKLGKGSE